MSPRKVTTFLIAMASDVPQSKMVRMDLELRLCQQYDESEARHVYRPVLLS
jgi:hypothetical protein